MDSESPSALLPSPLWDGNWGALWSGWGKIACSANEAAYLLPILPLFKQRHKKVERGNAGTSGPKRSK